MSKTRVIAIVGPTASGKTALGINISKAFSGEVVSADSMQIYNNMPIASAAPDEKETEGIKHHLIGFAEPSEKFSVAEFIKLAKASIEDIEKRNKLPVIVGGTGLYIDSLLGGISFDDEESETVRKELEKEADEKGTEVLFERLKGIDPKAAEKLHINDRKRIIRALEIFQIHGKTKTELDAVSKLEGSPYEVLWIGITYRDREKLYERINKRVDIMLENGLLAEAERAFNSESSSTSVQAIGHKEFFPYFKGEITLEEAVQKLKTETRRYAKRQLTWFRKNQDIIWVYADCEEPFGTIKPEIEKFLGR